MNVKHSEGSFEGTKNTSLYYQRWLPEGTPAAILVVVHGMAEHSGRYLNLVNYFVPRGCAVYGYDHRGHGRSGGPRCYAERFSDYVADLATFLNIVRTRHPQTRPYLIGHSMGGTIAVSCAAEHQDALSGIILSGTMLKPGSSVPRVPAAIASLLSFLAPKTGTAVIDASAISRDRAVVEAYINDPLVYRGRLPARPGAELLEAMRELPSGLPRLTLPALIMHGTDDRLAAPEGSRILYQRLGAGNKTLRLYKGFYHEIFNEPDREQVFKDMESWLTNNLPPARI